MYGMLQGLEFLHEERIMHRDLKPDNIILRNSNTVDPVIVDFGLAAFSDQK
jgi:calcium/calmodulin-dependent protein kinase I